MLNLSAMSVSRRLWMLVVSTLMGLVLLSAFFLLTERTLIMKER